MGEVNTAEMDLTAVARTDLNPSSNYSNTFFPTDLPWLKNIMCLTVGPNWPPSVKKRPVSCRGANWPCRSLWGKKLFHFCQILTFHNFSCWWCSQCQFLRNQSNSALLGRCSICAGLRNWIYLKFSIMQWLRNEMWLTVFYGSSCAVNISLLSVLSEDVGALFCKWDLLHQSSLKVTKYLEDWE